MASDTSRLLVKSISRACGPYRFCLLACGFALATQAFGQVYKCTDVHGKAFYSQSPCPADTTSKVITGKPAAREATAATKAEPASKPELEFRKRQKEREEAEKKSIEQAARAKQEREECQRARGVLGQYESGMRIANVDQNGERYYLDEGQIDQEKARLRGLVAQLCK